MPVLGTLVTATTYGTWLRGDARGWVEDGIVMPPEPLQELADFERLEHPPYFFPKERLLEIGGMICEALSTRLQVRLLALTVQAWHLHFVCPATLIPLPKIVKCAREAVRYGLKVRRPIWTEGVDKRFCFDWERLRNRVGYVELHNERAGWARRPWALLMPWEEYVERVAELS